MISIDNSIDSFLVMNKEDIILLPNTPPGSLLDHHSRYTLGLA
jgi:hypothetical protein